MGKNDWLKKVFMSSKLAHVAMKKITVFCGTKHPTKEQVQKYKKKMSQWIDDDKRVYIREDLAYKMICYMNQGVIEANEFRKNLGVENDKPIRIEKEIITMIMKIFAKENLVSQYEIPGLPYLVDLCFVAHKLITEIDKKVILTIRTTK